jgi:hypothetical protein
MTIRRITCFALVLWLAPVAARADADQDVLASAKTLYESAAYEAALSELGGIEDPKHADAVSTYQALCLLGLGRTRDAERALETLVVRQPLLKLSDADYSPRVVALFRDVRQRALPQAAQQLYATAKTEYDNKNYEAAAARFQDVLHLIDDVDAKQQTATLADIKQLADGFLTLANGKVVRQAAPVAAPVAAPAPPPAQPLAATRTPAPATKAPAPTTKAPAATTTMTQAAPTTAPPAATAAPGANGAGCRESNGRDRDQSRPRRVIYIAGRRRHASRCHSATPATMEISFGRRRADADRPTRACHRRERRGRECSAGGANLAGIRRAAHPRRQVVAISAGDQRRQTGEIQTRSGYQRGSHAAAGALTGVNAIC